MKIDEIITAAFGPTLESKGFLPVTPRKWVREKKTPIREIFAIQALKGATYSAVWGFSMDFSPIYRGGKFGWKRTNKSCDFDLTIDPIDEDGGVPDWCSFMHLPEVYQASLKDISVKAAVTIPRAFSYFDRVHSIADLTYLFADRSHINYKRFSFDNYIQAYLGWGLALYAIRRDAEGDALLQKFCNSYGVDRDDAFITKAVKAARETSNRPVER